MSERWKTAFSSPITKTKYEVSNLGNVKKNGESFSCKLHDGYKEICGRQVHRIVYKLFGSGSLTSYHHVHHKDGNILNNNISNLEKKMADDHRADHNNGKKLSKETKKKISKSMTEKINEALITNL